jgi:hypothetical protein
MHRYHHNACALACLQIACQPLHVNADSVLEGSSERYTLQTDQCLRLLTQRLKLAPEETEAPDEAKGASLGSPTSPGVAGAGWFGRWLLQLCSRRALCTLKPRPPGDECAFADPCQALLFLWPHVHASFCMCSVAKRQWHHSWQPLAELHRDRSRVVPQACRRGPGGGSAAEQ